MSLDADLVTGTLMFRFLKRDSIALMSSNLQVTASLADLKLPVGPVCIQKTSSEDALYILKGQFPLPQDWVRHEPPRGARDAPGVKHRGVRR